jgi:hypothetical protein
VATGPHKYALGCSVCQSADVVAVCHHCGLPFCADHVPVPRQVWYRIDPEYRGLELAEGPPGVSVAVHCHRHRHDRFNWHPFYRSAALFVFALLVPTYYLFSNGIRPQPALIALYVLAAGLFMLGFAADYLEERASEPPLPLFGRGPALELREFVSGNVRLRPDGGYRAEMLQTAGRLDFRLAPDGSEGRRREALRRRYHLRSVARVSTSAGYLALQGRAHLRWQGAGEGIGERQPHILALGGPAEAHPFFPLDGDPQPYTPAVQYEFALDGDLPVRLLPALVTSEGEQEPGRELGLELTVQVLVGPPHLLAGAEIVVKELVLCVPPQLGAVRSWRPAALEPDGAARCNGDRVAALSWQNVELLQEPEGPPVWARTPGYHRTFYVRFAHNEMLRRATVSGHLLLRVEQRLLSGLNGALYFSPVGHHRDDLTSARHSEIRVNFELSLDSLTVHAPLERERQRQYGGPVGYERVLELSRALSRQGFYVKQVVEHTSAVVQREDAPQVERSWTVAGRIYSGVYPIDFEVLVSCPERARRRLDGDLALVEVRAEALVSRPASVATLEMGVRNLLAVCDGVFSQAVPAPEPEVSPGLATPAPAAPTLPPEAGLPPGYDRQRQRDDQTPGV